MIYYDKLVRDKIPEIILVRGAQCSVRSLDPDEFTQGLVDKLGEELDEYLYSRNLEELVDLLEVIYTLAERTGEYLSGSLRKCE